MEISVIEVKKQDLGIYSDDSYSILWISRCDIIRQIIKKSQDRNIIFSWSEKNLFSLARITQI